jgi:hypothetical protein
VKTYCGIPIKLVAATRVVEGPSAWGAGFVGVGKGMMATVEIEREEGWLRIIDMSDERCVFAIIQ